MDAYFLKFSQTIGYLHLDGKPIYDPSFDRWDPIYPAARVVQLNYYEWLEGFEKAEIGKPEKVTVNIKL